MRLSLKEKLGALSGDRFVPRSSIQSVRYLDNARNAIRGLRLPGTGLPGVIALGTWRTRSTADLVAVYRNNPGYAIDLTDGNRIIVWDGEVWDGSDMVPMDGRYELILPTGVWSKSESG